MRKAFLMSVLARKHPGPTVLMNLMASSKVAYETLVCSRGIPSFKEAPLGNERWWIKTELPLSFLPYQTKLGNTKNRKRGGGEEKGPASLWDSSSLQSLASTAAAFCRADFRFGESHEKREPSEGTGKPSRNPFTRKSTTVGAYPERNKRRRSLTTGVGNRGGWGARESWVWRMAYLTPGTDERLAY